MKTSTLLTAVLAFIAICMSCSKAGYDDLKGQWIEQTLDTTTYENGKKMHYVYYYEYDFKEDRVIESFITKINDECVLEVSCEGNWDYIKGPFSSGSTKEGIIEIVYDMDTFTIEYDKLNDPSLITGVRELMIEHNEKVASVKKEDEDKYYGYGIMEKHPNYIVLESNNSEFAIWTRAEAYDKYGVGGGELEIIDPVNENDDISEPQSMGLPKNEFLNEAGTEYYECYFTDDGPERKFFLSLIPETGTGLYQAPSGNIYFLSIENENDNRTEFLCSATDADGNPSKIQFHIDLNDFYNIQGTMLGTDGETVMQFAGNLIENE